MVHEPSLLAHAVPLREHAVAFVVHVLVVTDEINLRHRAIRAAGVRREFGLFAERAACGRRGDSAGRMRLSRRVVVNAEHDRIDAGVGRVSSLGDGNERADAELKLIVRAAAQFRQRQRNGGLPLMKIHRRRRLLRAERGKRDGPPLAAIDLHRQVLEAQVRVANFEHNLRLRRVAKIEFVRQRQRRLRRIKDVILSTWLPDVFPEQIARLRRGQTLEDSKPQNPESK